MPTNEWKTVDKSKWGPGPWQDEPDKLQWTDEATGLPCLIVRGPSGALCGYAAVADGHPDFNRDYNDVDVDVHGGLTYSDFCQHSDDVGRGVCHVPEPGKPDRVWWLGFDCAHYGDESPAYAEHSRSFSDGTYRDVAYVRRQVTNLAKQLHARRAA